MSTDLVSLAEAEAEQHYNIIQMKIEGLTETQIARKLEIKRKDVLEVLSTWRQSKEVSREMGERLSELLDDLDAATDRIIKEQWEIVHSVDTHHNPSASLLAVKATALNNVHKAMSDRLNIMRQSGLTDNEDLAAELAEMESEKEFIYEILEHELCNQCAPKVRRKIGERRQRSIPLVIYDNE